jgi:hypothetical protein
MAKTGAVLHTQKTAKNPPAETTGTPQPHPPVVEQTTSAKAKSTTGVIDKSLWIYVSNT